MSEDMSDLRHYYETIVLNDRIWFICVYNDCQSCELNEYDMVSHIRQHLSPTNEDIEVNNDINNVCNRSEPQLDESVEEEVVDTGSDVSNESTTSDKYKFKCRFKDCGKEFIYEKPFINHINCHQMSVHSKHKPLNQKYLMKVHIRSTNQLPNGSHRSETSNVGNGSVTSADQSSDQLMSGIVGQEVTINDESVCIQNTANDEMNETLEYNSNESTNLYKCHINGCGKRFRFIRALVIHKRRHRIRTNDRIKWKNRNNNEKTLIVSDIHAFNQLKQKYTLKVERLLDRSIHQELKESRISDLNYFRLSSLKGLDKYYHKEVSKDNEKQYFCKYNNKCLFDTSRSQAMARHLHITHIKDKTFKCKVNGCNKVYSYPTKLRNHEIDHKCTDVCSTKNLHRFRERFLIDSVQYYKCTFNDCDFKTKASLFSSMTTHIHRQHLCPNRVKIVCYPKDSQLGQELNELQMNFNNNSSDIEIIDEKTSSQTIECLDFKRFIAEKNIKLDYCQQSYDKNLNEMQILLKIRPYFQRKTINTFNLFVCNKCQFNAKTLQSISIHLRVRHFIQ